MTALKDIQNGIWAGAIATGPMTLAMFAMQKSLPATEQSPLPPATLASEIAGEVGVDQHLSADSRIDLSMISHFGYGAGCGIAYALLQRGSTSSPLLKGAAFGAAVWTGSYLGWIPTTNLRASATKMPARRNALMIAAHLLWGACLGYAENELRQRGQQLLDGHRKAPAAE